MNTKTWSFIEGLVMVTIGFYVLYAFIVIGCRMTVWIGTNALLWPRS